jgi:hypothetical protein
MSTTLAVMIALKFAMSGYLFNFRTMSEKEIDGYTVNLLRGYFGKKSVEFERKNAHFLAASYARILSGQTNVLVYPEETKNLKLSALLYISGSKCRLDICKSAIIDCLKSDGPWIRAAAIQAISRDEPKKYISLYIC